MLNWYTKVKNLSSFINSREIETKFKNIHIQAILCIHFTRFDILKVSIFCCSSHISEVLCLPDMISLQSGKPPLAFLSELCYESVILASFTWYLSHSFLRIFHSIWDCVSSCFFWHFDYLLASRLVQDGIGKSEAKREKRRRGRDFPLSLTLNQYVRLLKPD